MTNSELENRASLWEGWDETSDESQWRFTRQDLQEAYKAGYLENCEPLSGAIREFMDWLYSEECDGRISSVRDKFEQLRLDRW